MDWSKVTNRPPWVTANARLNFGDCFSYALAKLSGQTLLFKGDDFAQTDIGAPPGS